MGFLHAGSSTPSNTGGFSSNNQNNIGAGTYSGGKSFAPGASYHGSLSSGSRGMSLYGSNDYSQMQITGGSGGTGWITAVIAGMQYLMAQKQFDIANDYYKTNYTDYQFVETYYRPRYLDHKNQAFSVPYYSTDYNTPVGGSTAKTKLYDEKWFQTRRILHRYATGLQMHTDYMFYQMRLKANVSSYIAGIRVEDARKDWMDERIHQHKVQALNFGITAGNIARAGLAQATETRIHALDEMGSRLGGLANGLSEAQGYKQNNASTKAQMDGAANYGYLLTEKNG